MLVRCERDNTTFEAVVGFYPSPSRQSKHYDSAGDRYIECPTCARRYFYEGETNGYGDKMDNAGQWYSDRPLTILPNKF